jgi:hypothetical protein
MQRLNEFAEGIFEFVDGAKLMLRVQEEISERFVIFTDPGP